MLSQWSAHTRFTSLALTILVLSAGIGNGLMAGWEIRPSPEFRLIYGLALSFTIVYWLDRDNRTTNLIRAWDKGWFFFMAWPVLLPYYLFKTRGARRALAIIFAWLAVYVLVVLTAVVIAALWSE
jgi:hypothetical protein